MITCESCKYARWDASLFVNEEDDGIQYISEQWECFCMKKNKFFLDWSTPEGTNPVGCQDAEEGDNNLNKVSAEHYHARRHLQVQVSRHNRNIDPYRKS